MPCSGPDKLPCTKASCWPGVWGGRFAHRGVSTTFQDVEGKGKLATKLGTKCIKPRKPQEAPNGPYGVSVMDEKGDLKLRGQGYLRSTFTYFNLPPQGRSPEGVLPFCGEGKQRLRRVPCHRAWPSWSVNLSCLLTMAVLPGSQASDGLKGMKGTGRGSQGPGRQQRGKDLQRQTWSTG